MNTDKYIGLPFKANGRDESGLDCWGLVRLFYKNELDIELPSFDSEYDISDDSRIEELVSQYKEGWQALDTPEPGCAVLFRILGEVTHIGIYVGDNKFLHIRQDSDSVLENLDNFKWNKRIAGFYKYVENTGAILNAVPHPLQTHKVTAVVEEGTTLKQLIEKAKSESNFSEVSQYRVLVNGIPVQEELWGSFTLKNADTVEYRCVLGKNNKFARIVLTLVVAAAAIAVGGWAAGLAKGLGTFGSAFVGVAAGAATTAIGMKLVDAIAPIVPPEQLDPGTSERQLLIDGGANQVSKYGAIPVVLGKIKLTPPLGAEIFSVFSGDENTSGADTGTENYLKILLIWGYGPLSIDYSTLKVGDVLLSEYAGVTQVHLDRITEPTTAQLSAFDAIYGSDTQQLGGAELPGPKRIVDGIEKEGLPPIFAGGWVPANNPTEDLWVERALTQPTERITAVLHFSQGLRRVKIKGDDAGTTAPAPVKVRFEYKIGNGTYQLWAEKTIGGTLDANNYITGGAAKKDAFSWAITLNRDTKWNSTDLITIRLRRETGKETEPDDNWRYSHECVLHSVTGYRNIKPTKDPLNTKIAKSAFSIKATEQINGRIEGINALVQSYCKDYQIIPNIWEDRETNNPASLFRYVLTHPGTPNRITEDQVSNKIDLQKLQYWHNYCRTKGFTYNNVIAGSTSVMGVLSEICAAGRASPTIVDGKWSVVIDEPQANIVQHFTPHNSWNFEGSKDVVQYPDCLRAKFNDEDNNYQENETLIYAAGKTEFNSELFEEVSFPGVTKRSLVEDHARWHMAQAKLRPERYTLETDMEYLVCNRGDRVKVTHDVPLWGLGSGRLKDVISSTQIELEEPVYLDTSKSYTIRIRTETGNSVTSNVVLPSTSGLYSVITLLSALSGINVLDLYMFGELNKESQDLIVLSIQPNGTNTATITLMDYGVTPTYNIFTDYLNYTTLPAFVNNITKPPKNLIDSFGTKIPLNITATSDETVMERKGPADFVYKLLIGFVNDVGLPKTENHVECQLDFADSIDEASVIRKNVLATSTSVLFEDVIEGETYRFRLRYIGQDHRTGPWTAWQNHTIVGKTGNASAVTGLSYTITETGIVVSWDGCIDLDYDTTVVKLGSDWSSATTVFTGRSNTLQFTRPATGTYEFLVKHVDTSGNESSVAATTGQISYTNTLINNANISITDSGSLIGGGGGTIDLSQIQGILNVAQIPAGSQFIKIVTTLPTTYVGDVVSYSNKLYRWNGTIYTAEVPTADLVGAITTAQLETDLTSRIDLIDGPSTLQNSVSNRLLNYATTTSLGGYATTVALQTLAETTAGPNGTTAQYTVKIDNAGHITGYGLSSTYNDATPNSEFAIRADNFVIAPPAVASSTAPTTDLYVGYVWLDTSVEPNVTKYYTGTAWSTDPQALPFVVKTAPSTVNGVTAPAGVYIPSAFIENGSITNAKIGNATIDSAKIASVDAAKITTGTLSADRISANSITANKLLVTSKGGQTILSDDPMFQDTTLWDYPAEINFESGTTAAGAKGDTYVVSNSGTDKLITSKRVYEITPAGVYKLSALLYRASASNRNMYIFVIFYDRQGNQLATDPNWGGTLSGYVYGGVPTTADVWARLGNTFGFGTARLIPESARYCKIGVWFNYSGNGTTTTTQGAMDLRLDEVIDGNELIVDGTITGKKIKAGEITADKIDSKGLSIYSDDGTLLFNAGSATPVAASAVSGLGTLATKNSVSAASEVTGLGTLATKNSVSATTEVTGLGTFATKSSLDYTEVAGTKPPSDANNTYVDSNGNIQGVSSGAGTAVSNASINAVSFTAVGVTVAGSSIVKLSGATAWNAQAYSNQYYYNRVYLSFKTNSNDKALIVGLNTDPTTNASYTSLDYAIYLSIDGIIGIYESNVSAGTFGGYNAGDTFTITYDGVNVIYYKNGAPIRTIAANITNPIYFDSSFYTLYSAINNVRFGPLAAGLDLTELNTIKNDAATAASGLATKLDKSAQNVLAGAGGFSTGNLVWDTNGVRTSGYGVGFTKNGIAAYNSSGDPTFTLDGTTGNATFAGVLAADSIQANSVTVSKLVIKSNSGSYLPDPKLLDLTAWSITGNYTYRDVLTADYGVTPKVIEVNNPDTNVKVESADFLPIATGRTYALKASLFSTFGSDRTALLYINFYNSSYTKLTTSWGNATYSGIVYQGTPAPFGFQNYGIIVGSSGYDIPSDAVYCKVGVVLRSSTGTDTTSHRLNGFIFEEQAFTDKLEDNAATLPILVNTSGDITVSTTSYVDVQTITYGSTGAPVYLAFAHNVASTNYRRMWTRVLRNSTVLFERIFYSAAGSAPFQSMFVTDLPTAGSTTYKLQCRMDISGESNIVSQRRMFLLETKK